MRQLLPLRLLLPLIDWTLLARSTVETKTDLLPKSTARTYIATLYLFDAVLDGNSAYYFCLVPKN